MSLGVRVPRCCSREAASGPVRSWERPIGLAAYPVSEPIDPVDIHATMYHRLGVNPREHIQDRTGRPWEISAGRVLAELLWPLPALSSSLPDEPAGGDLRKLTADPLLTSTPHALPEAIGFRDCSVRMPCNIARQGGR